MKLLRTILIIVVLAVLCLLSGGAWGEMPPMPVSVTTTSSGSTTNEVTVVPFLLATMDSTTGKMVLTEPPQWMLDGPKTNYTTIQIECMDALSNTVVSGEFKSYKPVAFVKYKVIEE